MLENLGAARRPERDLREHRVKALLGGLALDLGALFDTPLAPVVEVAHPDQVVERLGALELLAELAPADNLGEIVVAAFAHVVVRREVAVDEADGGVPHAARDSDAALVIHDVPQPGGFRGLEPVVHSRRDVRADKRADSHLSEGVFAVQRVRVPEGVGEARHPVVLALVEPVPRVVVALLAADDHHVVRAELLGRDSRLGIGTGGGGCCFLSFFFFFPSCPSCRHCSGRRPSRSRRTRRPRRWRRPGARRGEA